MSKTTILDLILQIKENGNTLVSKKITTQTDTIEEYTTVTQLIPPGTDTQEINLGGVEEAKVLFLKTDSEILIQLNDTANTAITVTRNLLLDGKVTALFVSNASPDKTATLDILLAK
jgi:hypothetical protein